MKNKLNITNKSIRKKDIKWRIWNSSFSFKPKTIKSSLITWWVVASLALSLFNLSQWNINWSESLQSNLFKSQVWTIDYNIHNSTLINDREKSRKEYQIYFDFNNRFSQIVINNYNYFLYNTANWKEFIISTIKLDNINKEVRVVDFKELKEIIISDLKSQWINKTEVESVFDKLQTDVNKNWKEIVFLKNKDEFNKKEEKIIDIIEKIFWENFFIK